MKEDLTSSDVTRGAICRMKRVEGVGWGGAFKKKKIERMGRGKEKEKKSRRNFQFSFSNGAHFYCSISGDWQNRIFLDRSLDLRKFMNFLFTSFPVFIFK